jgi:hypothetical protein
MEKNDLTFRPIRDILQWGNPFVLQFKSDTSYHDRKVIRMLCDWCQRQFVARRDGARFCSTACHDRYHIDERRKALAAYRAQQRVERSASFFSSALQPAADETDERNTVRRRA